MSRAAPAPEPSHFASFRGRTQTLGQWLAGIRWIRARRSDVWAIAVKHRMDSASVTGGLGAIGRLDQHVSLGADTIGVHRVASDVAPLAMDGRSADWMLEVPDAQGDREFAIGMMTSPVLPRSSLLRRAQGRRTLTMVGFGRDAVNGRVVWDGRGIRLHHEAQAVVGRIAASMDFAAEAYGRDKFDRVHDPSRPKRPWMSVHPMGGCRIASDASRGVVDFKGEVWWIAERIAEQAGRTGA